MATKIESDMDLTDIAAVFSQQFSEREEAQEQLAKWLEDPDNLAQVRDDVIWTAVRKAVHRARNKEHNLRRSDRKGKETKPKTNSDAIAVASKASRVTTFPRFEQKNHGSAK